MFTFADKDNDGKISYKVYFSIVNWITKTLQWFSQCEEKEEKVNTN